jgi:hypothetical protein
MNPTSLDNQSGAADDGHITRIVRLETQMDHVTSTLISIQRTQEQNHLAMLAQFEAMRDKIDSVRDTLNDKIDKSNWELLRRMDRQLYWLIGLFVTNLTVTVSIFVRLTGA